MRRALLGMVRLALVGALVGGLALTAASGWAYFKGKRAGAAERDAHWTGVVGSLERNAAQALAAAEGQARMREEQWRQRAEGAERDRQAEHAENRRWQAAFAAAQRDRDGLREQLAAAAAGGVAPADDTVASCRDRTAAFGLVLEEALRAHAECAAAAEDLAADTRAVLEAWPVNAEAAP